MKISAYGYFGLFGFHVLASAAEVVGTTPLKKFRASIDSSGDSHCHGYVIGLYEEMKQATMRGYVPPITVHPYHHLVVAGAAINRWVNRI